MRTDMTGVEQTAKTDIATAWLVPTVRLLTYFNEAVYHSSIKVLTASWAWRIRSRQQTSITMGAA